MKKSRWLMIHVSGQSLGQCLTMKMAQNAERTEQFAASSIVQSGTMGMSGDREESSHGVLTVPMSWTTWSSPTHTHNNESFQPLEPKLKGVIVILPQSEHSSFQ